MTAAPLTALIGGSGFNRLPGFELARRLSADSPVTPFGEPSEAPALGKLAGREWLFLRRHGAAHDLPPHRVNYRANLWALKHAGARRVIAFAAVGGIARECAPGRIVVPHQIIDYTWGRAQTFFDGPPAELKHIDFSRPYDQSLRADILAAAARAGVDAVDGAVHAITQGPRLESAAEIDRLERDGATIVGMTGMPEAALARELGIAYAAVAIVVNPAAGRDGDGGNSGGDEIDMTAIAEHLETGVAQALAIIANL